MMPKFPEDVVVNAERGGGFIRDVKCRFLRAGELRM